MQSPAVRRSVPIERDGTGPVGGPHATPPVAPEAFASRESAQSQRRSSVVLAVHEHAARQRTCRHHLSRSRLRGRPRSPGRLGLNQEVSTMRARVFVLMMSLLMPVGMMSLSAQTMGVREVSASGRSLIPLNTKVRYTTMVLLPDDE